MIRKAIKGVRDLIIIIILIEIAILIWTIFGEIGDKGSVWKWLAYAFG